MFFTCQNFPIYYDQQYLAFCWSIDDSPRAFAYFDHQFNQKRFYENPAYLSNAFDLELLEAEPISYDQVKFSFRIEYNYQENIFLGKDNSYYNQDLYTDLYNKIYFDGNLVSDNYYREFESLNDTELLTFSTNANVYDQNHKLRIENSSSANYQETEIINLYSDHPAELTLNFNQQLIKNYYFPIAYYDGKIEYERFTFIKLFPNYAKYPQNIKPLVFVNYSDPLNNQQLNIVDISDGKLEMSVGLADNSDQFQIAYKNYQNNYLFYVDDYYYYDLDNQQTTLGVDQQLNTKSKIIVPWDYSDHYTNITFDVMFDSYQQIKFNFSLNFYNQYSLRGEGINSKYHFEEIDPIEKEEYDCYVAFDFSDVIFPLTSEEIKDFLYYE